MKKLLSLILVTLMFVCGLGFVGCDNAEEIDDGIEFTADKPILDFKWELLNEEEGIWTLNGYEPLAGFNKFEDLSDYYLKNLKGNNFYLLTRGYPVYGYLLTSQDYFDVYKKCDSNELVINEYFSIYDEVLGTVSHAGKDTGIRISINFNIFIKPVAKSEKEFTFEFGKKALGDGRYYNYINVFSDAGCFATCFYSNYVTVPREWFENYFKTNLIYGDNL